MVNNHRISVLQDFLKFQAQHSKLGQDTEWFVGISNPEEFDTHIKDDTFYKNVSAVTLPYEQAVEIRDTLFEQYAFIPDLYYFNEEELEEQVTVFIYT